MDNFTQLEAIQAHLEAMEYKTMEQSTQAIFEEIVRLTSWNAFAGKMVAEYERDYKGRKEMAYLQFLDSKSKLSVSMAKDFIDSICGDAGFKFTYAERLNRSIVHTIDGLRSILSTLKVEMTTVHFNQ